MKAQRVFAYLIDGILIGILSSIICFVAGIEVQTLWSSGTGIRILYNPVMLMTLGVATVYFLTDVMNGGSPGKKLLGITVTYDPGKDKFSTALTRSLVKVLSIHLLIGIIMFFLSDADSSLHDKVTGTRVQKKVVVA